MKKKMVAGIVFAAMSSLMVGAPASTGHCVEGDSPGFSYFGQEGKNSDPTANECRANTGSPSERAPGQNK
jgi:hypothetical protein